MKFQTYGPFPIPNAELKGDIFAKEFNSAKEHLNEASGVYIFIDGNVPLYVGQAKKRSFGARIPDHFNKPHNRDLKTYLAQPQVRASLLLIALAGEKGDLRIAETNKSSHHAAIHRLEESLIGACLAVNPNLFNLSSVGFYKDTHVPGYLNTIPEDRKRFPAAKVLAKLLYQDESGARS
jgi:hypothetical protein